MNKLEVSDKSLLGAIEAVTVNMGRRIEEHGRDSFSNNHEALGVIAEEYHELLDAVKQNDPVDVANELLDIAVGCIFGVASMMEAEERIKEEQSKLESVVKDLQESK